MDGLWGGLAVAAVPVATAVAYLLGKWQEQRRAGRKDVVGEWQSYSNRLEASGERKDAVIAQQQKVVDALMEERADYREQIAELQTSVHFIYETLKRFHRTLKEECGHDPGELPALPEFPPKSRPRADADFLARQASQSVTLIKEADKVLKPPGGGPTP